jgi:hypothetical protein
MNSAQEDRFGMYLKVDLFLVTHALDLAFNPAIGTGRTALNSLISLISQSDSTATRNITGFTAAKNLHRAQQIAQFKLVRAGMLGYYTANPDIKNKTIVNFTDSEIDKFRDSELYMKSDQVLDLALPVKALLLPFGVAAAEVDSLETLNNIWQAMEPIGRQEEGVNKASAEDVVKYMAQAISLLTDTMDSYLKVVQYTNPNLYSQYLTARMIDDSGGNSGSEGFEVQTITVPSGGTVTFPMEGPPSADEEIYIRAIDGSVYLCGSTTPVAACTPGAGTFLAERGVTFKGLMANLGIDFNQPYVNLTNPSPDIVTVRIGTKK